MGSKPVEALNKLKIDVRPKVLGVYEVERIVAKRLCGKKSEYFIKWKNYSSKENTWEPYDHIPNEIITAFENPDIEPVRIEEFRERLALVIETGLKSKDIEVMQTMVVRHDVVRSMFPSLPSYLQPAPFEIYEEELRKAQMSEYLDMKLSVTGRGCGVAMPLKVKLFIGKSPAGRNEDGKKVPSRPVEKIRVSFRRRFHKIN